MSKAKRTVEERIAELNKREQWYYVKKKYKLNVNCFCHS